MFLSACQEILRFDVPVHVACFVKSFEAIYLSRWSGQQHPWISDNSATHSLETDKNDSGNTEPCSAEDKEGVQGGSQEVHDEKVIFVLLAAPL